MTLRLALPVKTERAGHIVELIAVVPLEADQLDLTAGRLPALDDGWIAIGADVVGKPADLGLDSGATIIYLGAGGADVIGLGIKRERREALGRIVLFGNVD